MSLLLAVTAATPVPLRIPATSAPLDLPLNHAQQAPALPAQAPVDVNALLAQSHQSALAQHAPWLTHTFAGFFFVCALGLIVLLAVQTTKQEGLSGTIGGRVDSPYRTRRGGDAQLARLTSFVALAMVFFGTLLAFSGI